VIDPQDLDHPLAIVELVHDAIRASALGPEGFELPAQRVSDPLGLFEERAHHEFDDGGRCLLRQSSEPPFGGGSHDELPAAPTQALSR